MLYSTKGGTKSESFSNLNPTPTTLLPLSTLPLILLHLPLLPLPLLPLLLPLPCHLTLVPSAPFVPPSLTMTHTTTYPPIVIAPTSPMLRLPNQRHMMKPWLVPTPSNGSWHVKTKCKPGSNLTCTTSFLSPKDERLSAASGFFMSNEAQMGLSRSTRPDLLPKASLKSKGLISIRPSLLWPSFPHYTPYSPLPPNTT